MDLLERSEVREEPECVGLAEAIAARRRRRRWLSVFRWLKLIYLGILRNNRDRWLEDQW
jgi:hypothetical protein